MVRKRDASAVQGQQLSACLRTDQEGSSEVVNGAGYVELQGEDTEQAAADYFMLISCDVHVA